MTPLKIDPEFESLFPPLADEEFAALEQSILREGCRHALILWNGFLVDGHNRYKICMKHGLAFPTTHLERTDTREGVIGWMINNQLARRNLTECQRIDIAAKNAGPIAALAKKKKTAGVNQHSSLPSNLTEGSAIETRKAVAKAAGVSTGTVSKYKKIRERAAPAVIEKARSGEVSMDVAALVSDLPKEEQVALAAAGPDAMKAAAKEARQANKQKRNAAPDVAPEAKESIDDTNPEAISPAEDDDELARLRIENVALRNRVEELTAASNNTEIGNQLAEALAEVQRLTDVCAELNSRIAILEKENDVQVQRQEMEGQKDRRQQQLDFCIDDRAGDVLMEPAESAAMVQPASAPQSVQTDAVVD